MIGNTLPGFDFHTSKYEVVKMPGDWHDHLAQATVVLDRNTAIEWLKLNSIRQRGILLGKQKLYQQDMSDHRWKHTHQGFCFNHKMDGTWELIDAQNRISAFIASTAETITVTVSFFKNRSVKDPFDRGGVRAESFLTGLGTKSKIARAVAHLEAGNVTVGKELSPAIIIAAYEANCEAIDTVHSVFTGKHSRRVPYEVISTIAYAYEIKPMMITAFAHQVAFGEQLTRENPAYSLRESLHFGGSPTDNVYKTCSALKAATLSRKLSKVFSTVEAFNWILSRRTGVVINQAAE